MDEGFSPINADIAFAPAIANLAQTTRRWGILETGGDDSGKLIEAASPGMSVKTSAACVVRIEGVESTVAAAASVAIDAAHGSLARYDIVYVAKGATSLSETAGTAAAAPVPPELPDNAVLLGIVAVGAAASSITNSNVTDTRQFVKVSSRITVDPNGGGDYTSLVTAIGAAVDGDSIKCLAGTHSVAGATVIGAKNLDIYGEGRNTIIKTANSVSSAYIFRITDGFSLRNLTIDGNESSATGGGEFLQIYGDGGAGALVDDIHIKDVWLTNLEGEFIFGTGTGVSDFTVERVRTMDNHSASFIDISAPADCFMSEIAIRDCSLQLAVDDQCIRLQALTAGYGSNWHITGNRIEYATGGASADAIDLDECISGIVANNIATSSATARLDTFLKIDDSDFFTITGNICRYATYAGILITDCSNATITGNSLTGDGLSATAYGISLSAGDRCVVTGNHIDAFYTNAIAVASDKNVIVGNYTGGTGITDSGTGSHVAENLDTA
ncbi:MAG: hypothetical protein CMB80_07885 [Flammeovirgaceae bacterium]|nr:hypothetical protein [Flammeovirgaceae bacterium]